MRKCVINHVVCVRNILDNVWNVSRVRGEPNVNSHAHVTVLGDVTS